MHWVDLYRKRVKSADDAVQAISSGDHVWIHGGCNNPEELIRAMVQRAPELQNVEVIHILTFGRADYVEPEYQKSFRHRALFAGHNVRQAVSDGRADFVPVHLSMIPRLLSEGILPVDVAHHPHLAARRARLLLVRGRHRGARRRLPSGREP